MNKAINILNTAKELNLKKASDLFLNPKKKEHIKKSIELPYKEYNLKSFLSTYRRALAMVASEGLGKESQDKQDFEFTNRLDEIEKEAFKNIFINGDSAEFTKYIEREMIDYLQKKGDVELLNNAYNLSFEIVHKNKNINYLDIESKNFITLDDAEEKATLGEERKEKKDEFKSEILKKFEWLLNSKNQKEFFKNFGSGELAKLLLNKSLNNPRVQEKILGKKLSTNEKFTRLKFFLIPKKTIIKKIFENIELKEFVTIKELSTVLEQEVYLTMKTAKNPFASFIKEFLEDENITKDGLEFYVKKRINGKYESSVITLPEEKLKELKKIKDKDEREFNRLEELKEIQRKIEAYVELINTPDRHEFYDMKEIRKEVNNLSHLKKECLEKSVK